MLVLFIKKNTIAMICSSPKVDTIQHDSIDCSFENLYWVNTSDFFHFLGYRFAISVKMFLKYFTVD